VDRKLGLVISVTMVVLALCASMVLATDAQLYFSSDRNGQNKVTNIQEGDEIWAVVIDNDENIDCDVRDIIDSLVGIEDPKTGAGAGWYNSDLVETGPDTGVFVSDRAVQIGTRESFAAGTPWLHTHIVDQEVDGDFDEAIWGNFIYLGDKRGWLVGSSADQPTFNLGWGYADWAHPPSEWTINQPDTDYFMVGRFENMDTLIGGYLDPNDAGDMAIAMLKVIDIEATITWDQEIYKDANAAASITVVDSDENVNCNEVEYVPVFILVNPGSWNPMDGDVSPTNFCMLLRSGGVDATTGTPAVIFDRPIRWYNIYNQALNADHRYYIQYDIDLFDTVHEYGVTPVLFYAQETGANTGVFQLNLNSILTDLEFNALHVRDVLAAYYLDPNDFDDFKLATAYIEERQHSITSFTDENRADKDLYWIGRDPVYVQVIDANANVDPCCPEQVVVHICDPHGDDDSEWLILDETSSNSPVFFTFAGTQLWPVWDALGVGLADSNGGFQLQLDNWKIEAFNEDDIYVRYNDVYYGAPNNFFSGNDTSGGMATLGDGDPETSFPPFITRTRVANDVSFDLMSVADTQVFDGTTTNMWFLDRQGNRVSGYVNSDCVFIEVLDPDQDEDQYRRERIDAFWDGGQNYPFGPIADGGWICGPEEGSEHPYHDRAGYISIFNENFGVHENTVNDSETSDDENIGTWPKIYVLNSRTGQWASVDLLETSPATGDFVSVICIDLTNVYECVPSLGVLPGDTIVAFYQDPSNHSDSAMISIRVGIRRCLSMLKATK